LSDSAEAIPNECLAIFRPLIPRRVRAVRQSEKNETANKKASGAHDRVAQFEPAPFNAFRKYSIVFFIPSSN
jgi:hypothetical protein